MSLCITPKYKEVKKNQFFKLVIVTKLQDACQKNIYISARLIKAPCKVTINFIDT